LANSAARAKRHQQVIAHRLRLGYVGQADVRPLIGAREIRSTEQDVPQRRQRREVAIEVPLLQRVMNAMKAVLTEDVAERPDVDIGRGVNEIGVGTGNGEHNPRNRSRRDSEEKRHRHSDGRELEEVFGEVVIAAGRAHLGDRMMHAMESPEPRDPVLGTMEPVVEKIRDHHDRERRDQPAGHAHRQDLRLGER